MAFPFSSSEAEKATPGSRRLETAFIKTMNEEWENDLNLIHMHMTGSINVEQIVPMFIAKKPRRLILSVFLGSKNQKF